MWLCSRHTPWKNFALTVYLAAFNAGYKKNHPFLYPFRWDLERARQASIIHYLCMDPTPMDSIDPGGLLWVTIHILLMAYFLMLTFLLLHRLSIINCCTCICNFNIYPFRFVINNKFHAYKIRFFTFLFKINWQVLSHTSETNSCCR